MPFQCTEGNCIPCVNACVSLKSLFSVFTETGFFNDFYGNFYFRFQIFSIEAQVKVSADEFHP